MRSGVVGIAMVPPPSLEQLLLSWKHDKMRDCGESSCNFAFFLRDGCFKGLRRKKKGYGVL